MQAITIYRAKNLDKAVHRQEAMPKAVPLSEQQLNAWKDLEGFLGNKREYFNGDDGNIWLIANSLFSVQSLARWFFGHSYPKFSGQAVPREGSHRRHLRQNEDSKELVFDSEIFDNSDEHQSLCSQKQSTAGLGGKHGKGFTGRRSGSVARRARRRRERHGN
jgi:hypothetical protein